jgi:hypothetical protein
MELSIAISLTAEREISYSIMPESIIKAELNDLVLAGPVKFTFNPFSWVALGKEPHALMKNSLLEHDISVKWSLSFIDDLEGRPLFATLSGLRALLLMGEMIEGIQQGFAAFNLGLVSLTPNVTANTATIDYIIPEETSLYHALGSVLCLRGIIDSLLFARGLRVGSAKAAVGDKGHSFEKDFLTLYQGVLTYES